MIETKYLPIGTILLIKNEITPYMITGYINKSLDKIKDYVCVPFPYGFMSDKIVSYFNHEDIEKVIFKGYICEKYNNINKKLNDIYNRK